MMMISGFRAPLYLPSPECIHIRGMADGKELPRHWRKTVAIFQNANGRAQSEKYICFIYLCNVELCQDFWPPAAMEFCNEPTDLVILSEVYYKFPLKVGASKIMSTVTVDDPKKNTIYESIFRFQNPQLIGWVLAMDWAIKRTPLNLVAPGSS